MDDNVILIKTEEIESSAAETSEVDVLAEQYEVKTDISEFDSSSNDRMTMDEIVVSHITSDKEDVVEISVEEAIGWAGGDNTIHDNLAGRDEPDQHPITSITGLRTELDQIEALQTVYSDKKQQADYYMWLQDNTHELPANPYGVFVSIYPDTDKIQICDGSSDVFGVTVANAAFIGNQEYAKAHGATKTGRDGTYCLVSNYGIVGVRRETTVVVGDYVVPNIRGEAKKSDGNYGYLVTALSEVDGVQYAMISLGAPSTLAKIMSDSVQDLSERMSAAEYNITSVTNVANAAYAMAKDAQDNAEKMSQYAHDKIAEAFDKIGDIDAEMLNLSASVVNACETSALAKVIADGAVSSAEAIRAEAVTKANEANAKVNNLIKDLEPVTTWSDPETGNTGAEYLTTYINSGLATKIEVQTVDSKTNEAFTAIEQNAKSITSLVSTIDKYSVGEHSQAYGLTQEQAKSILKTGYIYVPTVKHSGEYIYNGTEFQLGYYYEWDGEKWVPSLSTAVNFSSVFIQGAEATPYWVVTESDIVNGETTYDLGGLYKWENGAWVKVASASNNVVSRAISNISQTATRIEASVQSVKGDVADLELRVDDTETRVTTFASHIIGDYVSIDTWSEDDKNTGKIYLANDTNLYWYYADGAWKSTASASEAGLTGTLATIEQKADKNGASIAQVVSAVGKDGEITASSIVQAINDGKSSVSISGDYINLTGKVTFSSFDAETKRKIEADSIDVQIWSSRGNIFKSRDVSTILTCHVFSAGVDITNTPGLIFTWEKIKHDGTKDEEWMATPYGNQANAITISNADVFSRAMFNCRVDIEYE